MGTAGARSLRAPLQRGYAALCATGAAAGSRVWLEGGRVTVHRTTGCGTNAVGRLAPGVPPGQGWHAPSEPTDTSSLARSIFYTDKTGVTEGPRPTASLAQDHRPHRSAAAADKSRLQHGWRGGGDRVAALRNAGRETKELMPQRG